MTDHQQGRTDRSGTSSAATAAVKDVAGETKHQAAEVAGAAEAELRDAMTRVRGEMRGQAVEQTDRLGAGLRRLSTQVQAFSEGNRTAAGPVAGYVDEANARLRALADRVEREGFDGVVYDLRRVARQRPGMFLLGAAAAGFAAGRMMRSGMAVAGDHADRPGEPVGYAGLGDAGYAGVGDEAFAYAEGGRTVVAGTTDTRPGTFGSRPMGPTS